MGIELSGEEFLYRLDPRTLEFLRFMYETIPPEIIGLGPIEKLTAVREWSCHYAEGSYGPPCTDEQSRDSHLRANRHTLCQWTLVVYDEGVAYDGGASDGAS